MLLRSLTLSSHSIVCSPFDMSPEFRMPTVVSHMSWVAVSDGNRRQKIKETQEREVVEKRGAEMSWETLIQGERDKSARQGERLKKGRDQWVVSLHGCRKHIFPLQHSHTSSKAIGIPAPNRFSVSLAQWLPNQQTNSLIDGPWNQWMICQDILYIFQAYIFSKMTKLLGLVGLQLSSSMSLHLTSLPMWPPSSPFSLSSFSEWVNESE